MVILWLYGFVGGHHNMRNSFKGSQHQDGREPCLSVLYIKIDSASEFELMLLLLGGNVIFHSFHQKSCKFLLLNQTLKI